MLPSALQEMEILLCRCNFITKICRRLGSDHPRKLPMLLRSLLKV